MTQHKVSFVVALVAMPFATSGCALYKSICNLERPALLPPTVSASASPGSGNAPLSVELTAVGQDSDGSVVSYAWDLGDGNTATGATVRHTYASPGDYVATVTATDNDGLTAAARTSVSALQMRAVAPPPAAPAAAPRPTLPVTAPTAVPAAPPTAAPFAVSFATRAPLFSLVP